MHLYNRIESLSERCEFVGILERFCLFDGALLLSSFMPLARFSLVTHNFFDIQLWFELA